jgi:ketosteroid isomerase-like protein
MSIENVNLVREAYAAFGRGEVPRVLGLLDPEVEWIESDLPEMPTRGTHRGPQAVLEGVLATVPRDWAEFNLSPEQFLDAGDHVVVTGRLRAKAKATGRSMDAPFAHVFFLRHGRVARMVNYHDTAQWLRTLGR